MTLDRDRPEILTPPGRPAIAAPTPRVPMPEPTFAAIKDPANTNISPAGGSSPAGALRGADNLAAARWLPLPIR